MYDWVPTDPNVKSLNYDQLLYLFVSKKQQFETIHADLIIPTVEFLMSFFSRESVEEWQKIKKTLPQYKEETDLDIFGEETGEKTTVKKDDSYVKDNKENPYDQEYYSVQVGNMHLVKTPFEADEKGNLVYKNLKINQQQLIDQVLKE